MLLDVNETQSALKELDWSELKHLQWISRLKQDHVTVDLIRRELSHRATKVTLGDVLGEKLKRLKLHQ